MNFDRISQFQPNFTISTEFHNFDRISQFWPNFTILTKFHNYHQMSLFHNCRQISQIQKKSQNIVSAFLLSAKHNAAHNYEHTQCRIQFCAQCRWTFSIAAQKMKWFSRNSTIVKGHFFTFCNAQCRTQLWVPHAAHNHEHTMQTIRTIQVMKKMQTYWQYWQYRPYKQCRQLA